MKSTLILCISIACILRCIRCFHYGFCCSNNYSGTIILAPRGMLHKGALKRKYFKKYVFLRLFRFIAWHKKVIFHATNKQETQRYSFIFFHESKNYRIG